MSKRPLKPIAKEELVKVVGGNDLPPPPPLNPDIPRGGWKPGSTESPAIPRGGW